VFVAGLAFAFAPSAIATIFCVAISEPPGLLNVGYETEIRGTSSLGGGAFRISSVARFRQEQRGFGAVW
jgi:hypothetical protein